MIRKQVLIGCTAVALVALLAHTPAHAADEKVDNSADTYRLLNLFGDVFERVRSEYVEPVTDQQLIESALNGMLTSLDPHSGYLNAKSFRDMQVQTKGEFGGLGLEVTMDNGWVKVVSPIDDTPAAKAGLKPGDYITNIDGESVQGLSLNDAVDHMRGPVNTQIHLSVRREGKAPFDVTLTRAVIKIQTVKSNLIDHVGYIRLSQFVESTDTDLHRAIADLKKQSNGQINGYILDLRNDPGGLLDQAVAVSSDFIEKGEVVSTRSRHPEDTQRFNAHGPDLAGGLPMAVLINDGSASASEIVAGALQDHHRAILMGTKSFGKGSVQTIIPLPGYGAMRLTTARYYTPSGRSIQGIGIDPDITVQQAKVQTINVPHDQLNSEASLHGALRNDTLPAKTGTPGTNAKPGDQTPAQTPGQTPGPDAGATPPGATPSGQTPAATEANSDIIPMGNPATDYQLARAIDLIHGLALYHVQKAVN